MQKTRVWSLGQEDPLEKKTETHSSTLAWKIPWMEEPGGLQSMGWQKVWHEWVTFHFHNQYSWKRDSIKTEELFMCSGPFDIYGCGFPISSAKSHVQLWVSYGIGKCCQISSPKLKSLFCFWLLSGPKEGTLV